MHFYDITGSACCTNNKQIAGSVSLLYNRRVVSGQASEWGYKNQNSSYWGKFQWNFDQGKEIKFKLEGKFSYPSFKLSEWKKAEKWGEI